jgi:hypothetical protein
MQETNEKPKFDSLQIGIVFLVLGVCLFFVSVFANSTVLCLVGLGLTFWGALMLLIPPPKHIEASYLITASLPDYMTIDRMLNYLTSKNEAYNIPPCPKDVTLPEHLEGLKQTVTFIPAEFSNGIAEIEDIARGNFLIEKPRGLLITSPGIELLDKIEQKGKKDFTSIPEDELDETLSYLLNELDLAKNIRISRTENNIRLEIYGSLYSNLYSQKYNLKSINLIGCPLVNAAACAVAKCAGKPTTIRELKSDQNGKRITATFIIFDRTFEKRQKSIEINAEIALRIKELSGFIEASIMIVDLSFDILLELRRMRINWQLLETFSTQMGKDFSFVAQSMPHLNLDFEKISSAINRQMPKETSKEVYDIIKAIYGYFNGLSLDNDIKESIPNFVIAKAIILSYYTLNDILLGKAVNDKVNKKESDQLVSILQILSNKANLIIDVNEFIDRLDMSIPEEDFNIFIYDTRDIFKQQFKIMLGSSD